MIEADRQSGAAQGDLFEAETERALLDQLLTDSRLYKQSKDYKDLLDFVVRLRNFAPFNAMLLQVQKPGLSYAASARDWVERFGRLRDGSRLERIDVRRLRLSDGSRLERIDVRRLRAGFVARGGA